MENRFVLFWWIPAGGFGSSVTLRAGQACRGIQSQSPHMSTSPGRLLHSWPVCWTATEPRLRSEYNTSKEVRNMINQCVCLLDVFKTIFDKNIILYIQRNAYNLDTAAIKQDYLLDYLSILQTVSNNSNVGMRNDSQCIDFTISTRIHSLVIHCFTVNKKRHTVYTIIFITTTLIMTHK